METANAKCPQCGRYVSEDGYYHTRTGDPPVDIYCDQHCADKTERINDDQSMSSV